MRSLNRHRVIEIKPVADESVYPRSVTGPFQRWRWALVWLTQAVFYGLCWLPWNDRQAVLFDLEQRRFYLFDLVLWPQDTIYLALLLVLSALALFLFTAVAGRLWCGYTCPQTVYTEVFLWLEQAIEGDRPQRMKLDAAPWSPRKFAIKATKHGAWVAIALWTGFTFVGYFTPIRELAANTAQLALGPGEIFWILFYGAATYGNAGFLREQMCKYICPYARFQAVMFDRDTLIIAYDPQRGEPRGARGRTADPRTLGLGDCIDCSICVQVCPTGIDIRNGLQNECIACAACIDACDQVMDKMGYPHGLIRYSTENAVERKMGRGEILRHALRPRTLAYAAVFFALAGSIAWSLATRVPLRVDVLRDRAAMAREVDDGVIANVFRLQLINAGERPRICVVTFDGLAGLHVEGNDRYLLAPAATGTVTMEARVVANGLAPGAHPIRLIVSDADDPSVRIEEKTTFWIPN